MTTCCPVSGVGRFIITFRIMVGTAMDENTKGFLSCCSSSGSMRQALRMALRYSVGESFKCTIGNKVI